MRSDNERYERGMDMLKAVDGQGGVRAVQALAEQFPDLARYIIEFPFGDVYSRPGLTLRDREIATIAALTAMGGVLPQLKIHIRAGLNVGLNRKEIEEIIIQMAVYAGFPAAINGMIVAGEVFAEDGIAR